jgi:molecular chaperone GrpE
LFDAVSLAISNSQPATYTHMTSAKKPPTGDLDRGLLQTQVRDLQQEVIKLTQELEGARAETAKMKDLAARSQADLQNAKARVERERAELSAFAIEGILRRLLPTIDSFQRAFQHLPEELRDHEWVKGVVAIEQGLLRELEGMGLTRMTSLGAAADPARHDVLQQGPGAAHTVTEVFEEGYELNGKVLRPAKVRVGDGTSPNAGDQPTD